MLKKTIKLTQWFLTMLFFLAMWMILESGLFSLPGIWIIDASNNLYIEAVGRIIGMSLVCIGAIIGLLPLCFLVSKIKC